MPITVLAGRLLPFATEQGLFDALAAHATPASVATELAARRSAACPTDNQPELTPLRQAETAGDNSELLELLSRRASRPVARALAQNPATPVPALDRLASKAVRSRDVDTLALLVTSRLPVSRILELVDEHQPTLLHGKGDARLVSTLRARVVAEADARLYEHVARHGSSALCAALVSTMSSGSFVTTDEFVSWTAESNMPAVLQAVVNRGSQISDYVAQRLVEHAPSFNLVVISALPMSQVAALTLIASGNGQLVDLVLTSLSKLSDATVTALLPHVVALPPNAGDVHVLAEVRLVRHLPVAKLASLVEASLRGSAVHDRSRAFRTVCGYVSEEVWVPLLRSCGAAVAGRWLAGEWAAPPTLSAVTELAADPGCTLSYHGAGLSPKALRSSEPVNSVADYVGRFWQIFTADALDRPGVSEILDLTAPTVLRQAMDPQNGVVFATYLGRRISERFGNRATYWQVTLQVIESGLDCPTITSLLDTVDAIALPGSSAND